MKKIYLGIFLMSIFCVYAFDSSFLINYSIEPSSINTAEPVKSLALLNEGLVVNRSGKIYRTKFMGNNDVEIYEESTDLSNLNIDGQFSEYKNVIYYSSNGVLYSVSMHNGIWDAPVELSIAGYEKGRQTGKGGLYYGKWRYVSKGVEKDKMYNPFITNRGTRLYFSSKMEGGKGGMDIWYMELEKDGVSWSKPVNAKEINTAANEDFPFVDINNMMYFSSDRPSRYKGYNIYKKFMLDNSDVMILDEKFNSDGDDTNFVVSGGIPFFLTNKKGLSQMYFARDNKRDE